ncbi:hypothetical protein H9Y04_35530 [Streptomyces sp. TRM66268-LWL]|uniref:Tox-REase-7 domain-containing protein n=1 Tax=Streptomyces polyasparticus TaxID=2767826 RepID=A0ABR7SSC5_9ACTN|nr:hypothetical protein [Streptomyces polyasparticus]MBC9717857.1 hypothetical protein [Streptomyces polyasparticus]
MMHDIISPGGIPHYTGNLTALDEHIGKLKHAARSVREHGGDVDTRFQGLDAYYKAPEAGQLLMSTQPVQETSSSFADSLETVASALSAYRDEIGPLVVKLEQLRASAIGFVREVTGDNGEIQDFSRDQATVDRHNGLITAVNNAIAAFQKAETEAASKITGTFGGTQWVINDGSGEQKNAYGATADLLNKAEELPWGRPAHHSTWPFHLDYHLKDFGEGLIFDNIIGSAEGLVTLLSPGEEGDQVREGLGKAVLGSASLLADFITGDSDKKNSAWDSDAFEGNEDTARAFGKSFLAWDQWEDHPGRAASTIVFNALTLGAGPAGIAAKGGAAGKAGAGARAAGILAKTGELIDPIGAGARAVGAATRSLPKIADVAARITSSTAAIATHTPEIPHSVLNLPDGSGVRVENGEFIPKNPDGSPNTAPPAREPSAAQRTEPVEPPRQRELVGAGALAPEGAARANGLDAGAQGTNSPGEAPSPGGRADDLAGGPSASHDAPGGGADGPSGSAGGGLDGVGHADGSGAGHGDGASPGHTDSSSIGHGDGPGVGDGGGTAGPGIGDDGSNGIVPGVEPSRYGVVPDQAAQPQTGPMRAEQEAEIVAELDRLKWEPGDKDALVRSLRKDPFGAGVAEHIAKGHLREAENYSKILENAKKGPSRSDPLGSEVPGVYAAMNIATELQDRGASRVGFELGDNTTDYDLDIYSRDADGQIDYAYQHKNLQSVTGVKRHAAKSAAQLLWEPKRAGVVVMDVHNSISTMKPGLVSLIERQVELQGVTFLLRFEDGAITVPPNGSIYP